jgi:hypothetical protein
MYSPIAMKPRWVFAYIDLTNALYSPKEKGTESEVSDIQTGEENLRGHRVDD